jgi:acetylornithine deacetylase/succinyl-diaminopimelate desuccinylase-like protein
MAHCLRRSLNISEFRASARCPSMTAISAVLRHVLPSGCAALAFPEVELLPTARHPVVVGRWHVSDDKPTAMIYGHYDVQPADPLELWVTPPFEPSIRDDRFYARGATDDKGNMFAPLAVVEALVRTQGTPPINLTFFVEGEEEIGSPSLPAFVRGERDRLGAI